MAKKILGYVLAIIGIIGYILTYDFAKNLLPIPIPEAISNTTLIVSSVVLFIIGVFLTLGKSARQKFRKEAQEIPIFQGEQIVGFRRI